MFRFASRPCTAAIAPVALATAALPAHHFRHCSESPHFKNTPTKSPIGLKKEIPKEWDNPIPHVVWTAEETDVKRTHVQPTDFVDRFAMLGVKFLRLGFDIVSGYKFGHITERKLIRRILFLETAAGIPGMVAGTLRHLKSLRRLERDRGWIHTLTEEAENERMHMLTFMDLYRPGLVFRTAVLVTQGIFWNTFFCAYLCSPRLCHRFVGYLEEEAVRTYTDALAHMDSTDPKDASLNAFAKKPANDIAKRYWRLPENATMRDVILQVRADEANHRDVNHTFASMKADETNPFVHRGAEANQHNKK